MNKPPHHHMGRYARTLFMAGLMVCSSLAGCIFEDGSDDGTKRFWRCSVSAPARTSKW